MEQFRRKKSHSARAPSNLIASGRPYRGSNQTARHNSPKVESDSRSSDCDMIADKHRIEFESAQRTSKRPVGTPMKSLLADEMSKETEYTTRAPGVIAKLMGLDGMPSQQSSYKQAKGSSDGFHHKTVSAGSIRHRKASNNQSCNKIAREQYKDVYEVRECSRYQTTGLKYEMPPNMTRAEYEMENIRQTFIDAKRLSTDEKLIDSEEFHGETEVSDPNNYLFQQFLRDPDILLAKHLHSLHASQESHCKYVRNMRLSNRTRSKFKAGHLADIKDSNKINTSFSNEYQVGLHHHASRKGRKDSDLDKSAAFRTEANELARDASTNIVVLKPNLEGSRKSAKLSSSSRSSYELLSDGDTHISGGIIRLPTLDISSDKSRESKELAKEITRQMRNKLGETSFNVSLSGCRGYSADESSHDLSGIDSSYESYATFLTSRTSARASFHRNSSASRYAESSVSKEAKKRLSERWRMSHRSEVFSLGAKGGTLGQMLSVYDADVRLPNLSGETTRANSPLSFSRNSKLSGAVEPLGISSKDGWRDDRIETLSRRESRRTAYDHIGYPETRVRYGACGTETFLIPNEDYDSGRDGRKVGLRKDYSWGYGSSTENVTLRDKKINDAHGSQERRKGKKSITEAKNSLVQEPVVLESPIRRPDTMLTLDSETVTEHVIIPGDNVMHASEFTSYQVKNYSSNGELPGTTQEQSQTCHIDSSQYRGAQPEFSATNREADHPSPVSILDTPFMEDLSSGSECFERVSAELHGLRMQLQLLKMETGSASVQVSSDEDELTPCSSEEVSSKNWEASYMVDMLADYEFDDNNPDSFVATWHSLESPVGPNIFEKLEKKYSYPTTSSSRSDRRLLFDHINSSIVEIGQRITDPSSFVKPSKAWFEDELCKVLEAAIKVEKADVEDNEMIFQESKTEWMNLGKSIEDIGCDIAKMLLDELVSEALTI